MELYYEFLGIYGFRKQQVEDATNTMNEHVDSGYFEPQEVAALCKEKNCVIMFEVAQDDGDSECFIIDNKGEKVEHFMFSLQMVDELKEKLVGKDIYKVFDQHQIDVILEHMNESGIDEAEFIEEHLDELLLDEYEHKKYDLRDKLKDYYKKKTA